MNNPIPRIPSIIHDIMDLPTPELRRLVHQDGEVLLIRDVAGHADGAVPAVRLVDCFGDSLGFLAVDVTDDDFAAFVCEEAGRFGADALAAAGYYGGLVVEHALRVVEVRGDLGGAVGGRHGCVGVACVGFTAGYMRGSLGVVDWEEVIVLCGSWTEC